jgi:hypothetical protein
LLSRDKLSYFQAAARIKYIPSLKLRVKMPKTPCHPL